MRLKNKSGATFSGWTTIIILSVLFVILLVALTANMNALYNKNYDAGFGLPLNETYENMVGLQNTFETATNEGQASFTSAVGLSVSTSYQIIKSVVYLLWGFFSGSWIEIVIVDMIGLPAIVGVFVRLLYLLSVGFILLKILFRVRT